MKKLFLHVVVIMLTMLSAGTVLAQLHKENQVIL